MIEIKVLSGRDIEKIERDANQYSKGRRIVEIETTVAEIGNAPFYTMMILSDKINRWERELLPGEVAPGVRIETIKR